MSRDIDDEEERRAKADRIAAYFNAEEVRGHGRVYVHGQRIGVAKLEEPGVKPESLEEKQNLQNPALTAYHSMTLIFETTPSSKFIASNRGKMWMKYQPALAPG